MTSVLSAATQQKIRAQLSKFPRSRTALLPALKLAQAELGYLPAAAIADVAELVGVSHAAANELATFYSMLYTQPTGRLRVEVCVQLPCALAGAERLLKRLSEELAVAPGETSTDGRVTLVRTPECLGACHRAPMCRLNDEYVESLQSPVAIAKLVNRLNATESARESTP